MKKALIRIISLIVSAAAAFNIALPGVSFAGAETEANEVNIANYGTSEPTVFFDGAGGFYEDIDGYVRLSAWKTGEGIRFSASDNDPCCELTVPNAPASEMQFMVVRYRTAFTEKNRSAEIYFSTPEVEVSEANKISWTWDQSEGEWKEKTISLSRWSGLDEKLNYLRFDPIAGNFPPVKKARRSRSATWRFLPHARTPKISARTGTGSISGTKPVQSLTCRRRTGRCLTTKKW